MSRRFADGRDFALTLRDRGGRAYASLVGEFEGEVSTSRFPGNYELSDEAWMIFREFISYLSRQ